MKHSVNISTILKSASVYGVNHQGPVQNLVFFVSLHQQFPGFESAWQNKRMTILSA